MPNWENIFNRTNTAINEASNRSAQTNPFNQGYSKWLTDMGGSVGANYEDLYGRYSDIADEGILSQDDMAGLMANYRKTMQPQIDAKRAAVSSSVSRRLGSRSTSGAAQKAKFNLVDVPAMFAESEYASKLYEANVASRTTGLSGMSNLTGMGMNAQQNLANMYMQYYLTKLQMQHDKEMKSSGGSFWGDLFRAVPTVAGAFAGGPAGAATGAAATQTFE